MLTGRVPFPQVDGSYLAQMECSQAISSQETPTFREVDSSRTYPEGLEQVVRQCLEKDPARRPGTMEEVRQQFLEILDRIDRKPQTKKKQPFNSSHTIPPGGFEQTDEDGDAEQEEIFAPQRVVPPPPRTPWFRRLVIVLLIGSGVWLLRPRPEMLTPQFFDSQGNSTKGESASVTLMAGESKDFVFSIEGTGSGNADFSDAVKSVPPGITVLEKAEFISKNARKFTISADLDQLPGERDAIKLEAKVDSRRLRLMLSVELERPNIWMPEGFAEAEDSWLCKVSEDNVVYASILTRTIAYDVVRFRLIPRTQTLERTIPTFYIMESLVTNQMFNTFASSQGPDFNRILPRSSETEVDELTWETEAAESPVINVGGMEAQAFAKWLTNFKFATLPSTSEWELAAGYTDFSNLVKLDNIGREKLRGLQFPFKHDILKSEATIGLGPRFGDYQGRNGERLTQRSPYGCEFPLRQIADAVAIPILEMTRTFSEDAQDDLLKLYLRNPGYTTDKSATQLNIQLRGADGSSSDILWVTGTADDPEELRHAKVPRLCTRLGQGST